MSPILATRFLDKTLAKKTFDSPSKNNNEKEKMSMKKTTQAIAKLFAWKKKENYRPVSLLTRVSKIFERLACKQVNGYICDKLSKYRTGFRKCHGKQHSLLVILENRKEGFR